MSHSQPENPFSPSGGRLHARLVAKHQAEQQRAKLQRQRHTRIQAANDAVEDYLRKSGTRDGSAAFAHIRRTRPDLFADMQEPAGLVPAANFNPNHDELGRFASGDGAGGGASVDGRDSESGSGYGGDGMGGGLDSGGSSKQYQGKVSADAYRQAATTGECLLAIGREAVAQVETVRTKSDQPLPKDADKFDEST